MNDSFEVYTRPDAGEAELREAARHLGAVTEPPTFWSDIVRDESLPEANRRHAIVQLLRRHFPPGGRTVARLAALLDGGPWPAANDLTLVTALGGKVPVRWSPEDTVVAAALPGSGAVYLTIEGSFGAEQIASALRGRSRDRHVLDAEIAEVGFEEG